MDRRAALAAAVAAKFAAHPQVQAVALGGSSVTGAADDSSDVDLYVYADPELSLESREAVAAAQGTSGRVEIGNRYFESGDEWRDAASGIGVDVMHRDPAWIEDRLVAVLDRHEAALGYTTCLWHNVRTSAPLFDRSGWYAGLKAKAAVPYPDGLRRAIVNKNRAMLAYTKASWRRQLELALLRDDPVAVNHRAAAFLASWFDLLFALNREPHPGEKRLLRHARTLCAVRPQDMDETVRRFLAGTVGMDAAALAVADLLIAGIERLLAEGGLA
ncbi:MAG: DUF4037 domain-containing protein [Geminicoccaceae bacterium]|nr:DUF4037 domain-containing protein [Geminicoccaceae bacterium]